MSNKDRWVLLAEAPNQITAEAWQSLLRSLKIPCRLHPRDTISFLGISATGVRLLTTGEYLERAKEILNEETGPQPEGD